MCIATSGKNPVIEEALAGFEAYLAELGKGLLASWAPSKSSQLRTTLGHALRFSTWQSLTGQKLGLASTVELVTTWIRAAAAEK